MIITKAQEGYSPKCKKNILKEDPELTLEINKVLRFTYAQVAKHKNIWNYIS